MVDVLELDGASVDLRDPENPASFRLRMTFPDKRWIRSGLTADEVYSLYLEWDGLRAQGETPATDKARRKTLADLCRAFLVLKDAEVSDKTKRRLSARGFEWWVRNLRPWIDGEFGSLETDDIDAVDVKAAVRRRAVAHPKSASDELVCLKAVLRWARGDVKGIRIDDRILELKRPSREVRERVALSDEDLDLLAWSAPAYATRAILFAGKVGVRWGELVTLTRDRIDLDEGWIFIPSDLTKERARGGKFVDLFDDELDLLREQVSPIRDASSSATSALPAAPATSPYVFPAAEGGRYAHHQFLRLVWYKARLAAGASWREARGIDDPMASTPFTWVDETTGRLTGITPHDLRSTAVTAMRRRGMSRAAAAARIGHAAGGRVVDEVYTKVEARDLVRDEMRALRDADATARRAVTPADRAAAPGRLER